MPVRGQARLRTGDQWVAQPAQNYLQLNRAW